MRKNIPCSADRTTAAHILALFASGQNVEELDLKRYDQCVTFVMLVTPQLQFVL
jgi:hypothetical protein